MLYLKLFEAEVDIYSNLGESSGGKSSHKTTKMSLDSLRPIFKKCSDASNRLNEEYPDFTIVQRNHNAQFFDIEFKLGGRDNNIWIGTYDCVGKDFFFFEADSIEKYKSRKTILEKSMEDVELEDGFERFTGIWYEVYDEFFPKNKK